MMLPNPQPTIMFREVANDDYRCCWCKARVRDGMGCVAVVCGIEIDGVCCCENCAEANAASEIELLRETRP